MRKIASAFILAVLTWFSGSALATFQGPGLPKNVPFVQNGKTYAAYVQTWHPYYAQGRVCYYPTDFDQSHAPVIAASGVQYAGLVTVRVLLNPGSFSQAWDSTDYYSTGVLCQFYYSGGWQPSLAAPTNIVNMQYGWSEWYGLNQADYDLTSDLLIRAVGINIKVNATYDFNGQFDLGAYTSGDVVTTGSTLLKWPLAGTFAGADITNSLGENWTYGECPSGTYKKHAGIDVDADTDDAVYAAHSGTVKEIYTGQHSTWADAIVIEDTEGHFTTVYWHVFKYEDLTETNTVVRGQQIGTIASIGNLINNTHLHFGVRVVGYDSHSVHGALPTTSCGGYPAYPGDFIDPESLSYN